MNTSLQSEKAVSAYFTSKEILPFGFAKSTVPECVMGLFSIEFIHKK